MPVASLKPNGYGLFYMVVMFENVSRIGVMVILFKTRDRLGGVDFSKRRIVDGHPLSLSV